VPVDNILFASEMVGAVRGNDPKTGFGFDDTKRYVEGTSLSAADKAKVFEGNARKVYRASTRSSPHESRVSSPNGLELRDIPQPVPKPNEVLTRVKACGLNRADLSAAKASSAMA
jgi:hypothetical protein